MARIISNRYRLNNVKVEEQDLTQDNLNSIKKIGQIIKNKDEAYRAIYLEEKLIPKDIDYMNMHGLRLEAREKLSTIRPLSVGAASRISGVSPADITILLMHLG